MTETALEKGVWALGAGDWFSSRRKPTPNPPATLPNGEKFSGTYLQITSTTGGFAEESQAYENPEAWDAGFGDIWNPGGDVPVSHQDHSAKVIATLSGNRGDTMHCGFRLNNPKQGMARGGTGKCLVSSGGTIKVQF